MAFVESGTQRIRRTPGRSAAADDEEVQIGRKREDFRQRITCDLSRLADRPSPDSVRQAEQRTAMRHSCKTKTTSTVTVNEDLSRQMGSSTSGALWPAVAM